MKKKPDKVICLGPLNFAVLVTWPIAKPDDANSDITGHEKVKTHEITLK